MEPSPLTAAQQEQMVADGWVQLEGVIQGEELRALQLESARVEAETADDWRGHIAAGTRPAHHNGNSADGYGPTHHVVFPVMAHSDAYPELLGHPHILSVLRQFMGDRIINSDNGLCIKPPRTETHVGWHRCAPIPASPGKPQ